jgi:hypothetical protein
VQKGEGAELVTARLRLLPIMIEGLYNLCFKHRKLHIILLAGEEYE